jgi:hypothetical protein
VREHAQDRAPMQRAPARRPSVGPTASSQMIWMSFGPSSSSPDELLADGVGQLRAVPNMSAAGCRLATTCSANA